VSNKSQLVNLRIPSDLITEILQYGQTHNLVKANGRVNLSELIVMLIQQSLQISKTSSPNTASDLLEQISALQTQVQTLTNELANTVKLSELLVFKENILGELLA